MMKLVLASQNKGKILEISNMLADLPVEVLSLQDFPGCPEAEEPHETYLENAQEKAKVAVEFCKTWVLADDSGLEVAGLNWGPGVISARYAGENVTYEDNYRKMLSELKGREGEDRKAVFRCCMVMLHPDGRELVTRGELWGVICHEPKGDQGFGYDPIFELPEKGQTLAQLSLEEKNKISHRTQALELMKEKIKDLIAAF